MIHTHTMFFRVLYDVVFPECRDFRRFMVPIAPPPPSSPLRAAPLLFVIRKYRDCRRSTKYARFAKILPLRRSISALTSLFIADSRVLLHRMFSFARSRRCARSRARGCCLHRGMQTGRVAQKQRSTYISRSSFLPILASLVPLTLFLLALLSGETRRTYAYGQRVP